MSEEVYKRLAKHFGALGMGYPEKEELIEVLRENFTSQEAEVALAIPTKVIPFEPVPVSEIAPHVKISKKELESILSNLAHRGLLFSKKMKKGKRGYALQQFGYGFPQTFFWRGVETPNSKKMAELIVKYSGKDQLHEAYGETSTKALEDSKGRPDGHLFYQGDRSREMYRVRSMCRDLPCPGDQNGRGFPRGRPGVVYRLWRVCSPLPCGRRPISQKVQCRSSQGF
jgi:hypothetical protein